MEKYRNKFKINSSRVQTWDYTSAAVYFLTICTFGRETCLADRTDEKRGFIELTEYGKIVREEWLKTIAIRPDMNLKLHDFVVMPDHFHALIEIGRNEFNVERKLEIVNARLRDAIHRASATETFDIADEIDVKPSTNRFGPQSKNVASIVRGFKSAATSRIRRSGYQQFAWQSGYHDRIISDQEEFETKIQYIRQNPEKWFYRNKCQSF
jgi:putative transposase